MGKQRPKNSDGTYQETSSIKTTASTTVPTGVQADFAGTYADSNALAMALAESAQVRECVARQMFRSSSGRSGADMSNATDRTAVDASEDTFIDIWNQLPSANQGKFVEMLVAYVRSPLFDKRSLQ
jgi:hypothetical protein